MWLWKKFWNTDIIGKIYILMILFIIVVATITIINRNEKARLKETTNNIVQNEINMLENNEIATTDEQEQDNNVIEERNINEETKGNQISSTNTNNLNNSNKKNTGNDTKIASKEETKEKEETKIQEKTNPIIKEQVKEEIQEQPKEEIKQETKEEVVVETAKEEYKVNTNMINTMKNYIQNNPSEDMITYGYEVAVDSSIVELTNQFTYTEQRMKNFLKHRFGTIKIYAMDYYYDGNLVMTECFIL